jgi:glucose/arabinose dehydrogenase
MRNLGVMALVVLACACGKKSNAKDDAKPGEAAVDAPAVLPTCTNPVNGTTISVRKIGNIGGSATLATAPIADPRLFVIRQDGLIDIFENGLLRPTPFLDITAKVNSGGEMGLLGLAFHPKYASNGKFYVDYTASNPNAQADPQHPYLDVLEEYTVSSSDPYTADPMSGRILIAIPDPFTNHNAGMVEFGPDQYLYVTEGDGGSGGDPFKNGQNTNVLLAKMLRIDVDHQTGNLPYGIPADNPFAAGGGAPEIFMYGLRNPWRWSFDKKTGDMWIGDVGQNYFDELDVLLPSEQKGANLGWSMYEGNACCANAAAVPDHCQQSTTVACDPTGKIFPKFTWAHQTVGNNVATAWRAPIGGTVYRGTCYPDIVGKYYMTDNSAHVVTEVVLNADLSVTVTELPAPTGGWPQSPASLHDDARGELYLTTTGGDVWHIEAGP